MQSLDQQALTAWVQQISLTEFQRPFLHQVFFNARLKTTGGRYHLSDHHLDFNPKIFAAFDAVTCAGVIKHELCHYHLHLQHLGYQHGDADFKHLLARVGGLRYAPNLPTAAKSVILFKDYQCIQCGQHYYRRRKMNTQRYVCSRCHGHLKFQGEVQTRPA